MKERIKKFWKDNEAGCIVFLTTAVTTTIMTVAAVKAIEGLKVVYVGDKVEDGLRNVIVVHKNGSWSNWTRPVSE